MLIICIWRYLYGLKPAFILISDYIIIILDIDYTEFSLWNEIALREIEIEVDI